MTEQAGEAVPAAQRGSWTSFLKSIASFSGDLSSLTAPPFILSPVSLTEFPAYWCERPELFAAIADAKTAEDRSLAVLRWFISTLKGQYTSRNESMGSEKKPLNPVLGELFYGYWPDKDGRGRTNLLVEQVSHHPPVTAYVIENKTKGVKLVGHNAQKTSFSSGSIMVRQVGHAILTVAPPGGRKDEYLITLPRLRIDGLWYGSPYVELAENSYVVGGGYISSIEYKGRGYFSGKSHTFKAITTPDSSAFASSSKPIPTGREHITEGTWHEESKFTKTGVEFHNVHGPKEEVTVIGGVSGGEMGEFETRNLWSAVAKGIKEGDYEAASREKSKIENDQRQRRKDEQAAGTTWPFKHFNRLESDPIYEELAKVVKLTPPVEDIYEFQENWPPTFSA
ncbi:Oxysterol-binding protein [Pluteus cervinus]|uniref:Oxysterol-binding protein n=1 Tax=Pluteus cervinus TaxID=181527 RepID=A0ACD3AVK2_9AGAR|nr:Oxysterol-binding protein [Pluteus cervinus]